MLSNWTGLKFCRLVRVKHLILAQKKKEILFNPLPTDKVSKIINAKHLQTII